MKHAKEPWRFRTGYIENATDNIAAVLKSTALRNEAPRIGNPNHDHNGERIVQCVNALQGIEDPQSFVNAYYYMLSVLQQIHGSRASCPIPKSLVEKAIKKAIGVPESENE